MELQDIVRDFLVESYENLEQLDRDLVALEQDPRCPERLGSIFRTLHTLKGTCGFLGFGKLEAVAHAGENLLSRMRDGKLTLRPDITTALLSLVDAIRDILGHIETTGQEGEAEYDQLLEILCRLQEERWQTAAMSSPALPDPPQVVSARCDCPDIGGQPAAAGSAVCSAASGRVAAPMPSDHGEPSDHVGGEPAEAVPDRCTAAESPAHESPARTAAGESRQASVAESTIRVDVGLLDKLMNRVGELVLARNQILQFTSHTSDAALLSTCQRLNLITTELQEGVMKTRMQPIGNIWGKFPRLVRDLALACGKQVQIHMEGKETELDKTIIEAIKDPLTHLVRNAIDHGIEPPQARLAAGKPAEGCLRLRAFHEGGQVNIEISDDGAGLNIERIRQKAVERGLLTREQALRLSDREVSQLIFAPGFSTARQVTNVSGRGVGMDVVKTNIERIGGTVDVHSQPGQGTTVKLKIPLTLAIIPALIVTCDADQYAIPQVSLLELVRLEGEQARCGIERLHGAPVYRLRGQLLPILYLQRELGLPDRADRPRDVVNIVVLRADERTFGLVVDAINDTEEIVVKPLSQQLKGIPVYAGATIMGDGKVALILDVLGLAQRARVVTESRDRGHADLAQSGASTSAQRQTLLLLEAAGRRLALPIEMVSRLEEIPPASVERADQQEVVQYRGQILPLVRVGQVLGLGQGDLPPGASLQVVVYRDKARSVGLVVDRIADIVECTLAATRAGQREEIVQSAVIQNRVTDLLNLPALVRQVEGMWEGGAA
jgi:two-component system chemotaxis sensor kinase CheA